MKTKTPPRLPEVGEYVRTCGELIEVQDVTPPVVKAEDWIFREQESRVEMRVNGKRVKTFGTFNDFYGKDTCVQHAIAEAKEQMAFLGPADVEFVVVKVTSHCRRRPMKEGGFYDHAFVEFRALEHGSGWNLPEDVEEDVWSSKTNAAAE